MDLDIPSKDCKRCREAFYGKETENFCLECNLAFDFLVETAAVEALAGILASPHADGICGSDRIADVTLSFAESLVSRLKDRYATDASCKG